MNDLEYTAGFKSRDDECDEIELAVSGSVPSWLNGTLIRNGPSIYNVGSQTYKHWFDGLSKLHRFGISNGQVTYTSRFLRSKAFEKARETGKISYCEFATNPERSFLERIAAVVDPRVSDNANVSVTKISGHCVAMTETPVFYEFDPDTLATLGQFSFGDKLEAHVTTAHPHYDFDSGEFFNLASHFSATSSYIVYRVDRGTTARKPLAVLPVKEPGYIHSFAMTARYVIICEYPLRLNALELITSGKPYIENYHWKPGLSTRFHVIDKSNGTLVATLESEACFAFHQVNAFEKDDEIIIDLLAYADNSIVRSLYLDRLLEQKVPAASLTRIYLSLASKKARQEKLSDGAMELATINYRQFNTRNYRYLFGPAISESSNFFDRLDKFDISNHTTITWSQAHCFPGEPLFVSNPEGTGEEDDGVILSVVLDAHSDCSFLLILDARTLDELARAQMPVPMPFGFHGQFLSSTK